MGAIASIPQVCEERRIVYHQRAAHFYRTISYFFSAVVVDIPLSLTETFAFTVCVFWLSGMWNQAAATATSAAVGIYWGDAFWQFLNYFGILTLTNMAAKQVLLEWKYCSY